MSKQRPSPLDKTEDIYLDLLETGTAKEKASPLFPKQSSLPSVIVGGGPVVMSDKSVHSLIPVVHTLEVLCQAATS